MRIWKISLAAALLVFPACAAVAATTTTVIPQGAYYPAPYPQYNPMNYGVPPSGAPGQAQQMVQGMSAPPQPGMLGGQAPAPTTYHYKGKSLNGAISKDEMPQRLFHNIPRKLYGGGSCSACAAGASGTITVTATATITATAHFGNGN